jgi:hypothetical protein
MMTDTDTSAEARHWIGMAPDWAGSTATEDEPELREFLRDGATHMAVLLAERDAERVAREQWQSQVQSTVQSLLKAEAERDGAIQRGNDWCDQARKLRGERDRLREALQILIANADMHPVVRAAALDIASTALKETPHD